MKAKHRTKRIQRYRKMLGIIVLMLTITLIGVVVRGDLYRCAGRFRHLVRNTHAGRLRHPHLCRQSQTHARRGIHPAGYERTGELERHRQIIQKG